MSQPYRVGPHRVNTTAPSGSPPSNQNTASSSVGCGSRVNHHCRSAASNDPPTGSASRCRCSNSVTSSRYAIPPARRCSTPPRLPPRPSELARRGSSCRARMRLGRLALEAWLVGGAAGPGADGADRDHMADAPDRVGDRSGVGAPFVAAVLPEAEDAFPPEVTGHLGIPPVHQPHPRRYQARRVHRSYISSATVSWSGPRSRGRLFEPSPAGPGPHVGRSARRPVRGVPASRPLAVLARLARSELAGDEGRELLVGRLSPADAERMPGRIRVHLVTFVDPRVRSGCISRAPSAMASSCAARGSSTWRSSCTCWGSCRAASPAERGPARGATLSRADERWLQRALALRVDSSGQSARALCSPAAPHLSDERSVDARNALHRESDEGVDPPEIGEASEVGVRRHERKPVLEGQRRQVCVGDEVASKLMAPD